MSRKQTAAEQAAERVQGERGRLVEWETTRAAAEAELGQLQAVAGDQILDDPALAESLPKRMQEQRDRIDSAARAIDAQRTRVSAAESAYLLAEAEALEPAVAAVRAQLERHQARTAELLAALEKHEGSYVPERDLLEERAAHARSVGGFAGWSRDLAKSELLEQQLADVEFPARVLRAMAAGQDPAQLVAAAGRGVDAYPACVWGPDALVPAPAYLRTVEAQRQAEQQRQTAVDVARRRVEDLERAIANGETAPRGLQDWTLAPSASLPEQLDQARRQLAQLTGQTVDG